ncbi:MAG: hypothetical protein P4L36_20320 [Holophaga sp.]|nr:hypothetical protein [Holophaga sp.]
MGAAWAGIDAAEGIAILTRTQIIGYSANGPDPSTRFRAIPGEGGILPDGLRVDTTRTSPRACCATVRFPLGLFDHEKWVPFGAKALKIQLKWRVRARRPWAKALPAWRVDANEHGPVDQDGQQHLRTFWGRNVLLAEHGRLEGVLELAIHLQPAVRTLPGSKDVLFGPLALIPAGWDIEFRGYDVTPVAPSQVSDPPIGELARYEAWYLEHEDKPSAIDLRWRAPGMRP